MDRDQQNYGESVDQLADQLSEFAGLNRRERVAQRNRAENLAQSFDWKHLIQHYRNAYELALREGDG